MQSNLLNAMICVLSIPFQESSISLKVFRLTDMFGFIEDSELTKYLMNSAEFSAIKYHDLRA